VTETSDILYALGLDPEVMSERPKPILTPEEEKVITLLAEPTSKDMLIRRLELGAGEAGVLLMQMEIKGYIKYTAPHYITLI
jgi:predicted Rossmann fold nucleotide-binding protein DprA/Smf involved in DNA uptake